MNAKLLKELALAAGLDLRPQWDEERGQMVNKLSPDQLAFAQAIVQECLDTIESASHESGDEWDRAIRFVAADLREHFEVGVL